MSSPLVSIIIPVYNREKLVVETIASCLAQTYPHVEIIAVDDCSKDGTFAMLESMAANEPRLRVFRSAVNMGLCITRNIGASHAQGDWIWFLDSDDLLMPNAVETLLAACLSRGVRMALSGECGFWDHELEEVRKRQAAFSPVVPASVPVVPLWGYWPAKGFSFTGVLFSRDLYVNSGGFRPQLGACDEADMCFKFLLREPDLHLISWPVDLLLKRYDENSMACQAKRGKTPWPLVMGVALADLYLANPNQGTTEVRRYLFDELYRSSVYAYRNGQLGFAQLGFAKWCEAQLAPPTPHLCYHAFLHRWLGFQKAEGLLALARKMLRR